MAWAFSRKYPGEVPAAAADTLTQDRRHELAPRITLVHENLLRSIGLQSTCEIGEVADIPV